MQPRAGTSLHRRAFTLLLGEGAARVLGILIFVILARSLGVASYGTFSFAMSLAAILGLLVDLGQNSHLGRVVAWDSQNRAGAFRAVAINKLVGAVVIAVAAWFLLPLLNLGHETRLATVLMIGWSAFLSILDSLRAITRSLGRMRADSVVNALESTGRLSGVCVAWALGVGVIGYTLAFSIEALLACACYILWLSRRVRLTPQETDRADARPIRVLLASLPLGLAGIASAGFYRIDQVLIVPLIGATANGLYGAAVRVVFTGVVLAALVVSAAYPQLAAARDEPDLFARLYRRTLLYCGICGVGVAIVIVVFARPLVSLLYGSDYIECVPLLRLLALVAAFNGVVVASTYALAALRRERLTLVAVTVLLCVNVVGNVILLPAWGIWAAVYLSVAGEVLLAAALLFFACRELRVARRWAVVPLAGDAPTITDQQHAGGKTTQ